jgi:hypothetical protein
MVLPGTFFSQDPPLSSDLPYIPLSHTQAYVALHRRTHTSTTFFFFFFLFLPPRPRHSHRSIGASHRYIFPSSLSSSPSCEGSRGTPSPFLLAGYSWRRRRRRRRRRRQQHIHE